MNAVDIAIIALIFATAGVLAANVALQVKPAAAKKQGVTH